jgi:hypothetical protein
MALAGMVGAAWLSVHAATPASISAIHDTADHSPIAEGCGYGWHWMSGYAISGGGWVTGHCLRDR